MKFDLFFNDLNSGHNQVFVLNTSLSLVCGRGRDIICIQSCTVYIIMEYFGDIMLLLNAIYEENLEV